MNDETKEVEELEVEMEAELESEEAPEEVEEVEEVKEAPVLKEAELPEPEAPKVKVGDHKGIKETKEVLKLGFAFAKAYKLAKLDGKIDTLDFPHLMSAFPHLGDAFGGIAEVPGELKDLSQEEVGELLSFAAVHLAESADSEELARKVEKSLAVGLAILDLLKEFK